MAKVGNRIRDKETREVFKITAIGAMIQYKNDDADGEIRPDNLLQEFDLLDDPSTREDIEAVLKAMVIAGEAETGLYDTGMSFVVVDRVGAGDEVTFQWFAHAQSFTDLLHQ